MHCLIQWPVCTLHLFGISLPSTLNYSTKNSAPQMGGPGVCPSEKAALWSVRREQHVSVNGHLSSDTGPVSSDLPLPAPASLSLYALRSLSRAGYPRTVSSVRAQPAAADAVCCVTPADVQQCSLTLIRCTTNLSQTTRTRDGVFLCREHSGQKQHSFNQVQEGKVTL